MNDKQKIEVDELITLLIDGEHTERQKTELKRLIRHESTAKKRLHVLYRQKKFLNALPIEKVPVNLVDDIKAAIERKSMLETFDRQAHSVSDSQNLLLRRLLTTAAMFLLPIGILGLIVWQIVKPPSKPSGVSDPGTVVVKEDTQINETSAIKNLVRNLPFDGILTLHTDRHITLSNFVEKAIFDQGLGTAMLPNRTVDVTTYQVSTSPEKIAVLIGALESAWFQCSDISLIVLDDTEADAIEIRDVKPSQIKALAAESSSISLRQLAQKYQFSNASQDTMLADSDGTDDAVPELSVPMLTGREETTPATTSFSKATVRLRIHIKRKMDTLQDGK